MLLSCFKKIKLFFPIIKVKKWIYKVLILLHIFKGIIKSNNSKGLYYFYYLYYLYFLYYISNQEGEKLESPHKARLNKSGPGPRKGWQES